MWACARVVVFGDTCGACGFTPGAASPDPKPSTYRLLGGTAGLSAELDREMDEAHLVIFVRQKSNVVPGSY